MPRTLQKVLGGCCTAAGGGGSYTKFSVLLWAKAFVLTQAQAEQKANCRQTIKDSTKIFKKAGAEVLR